MLRRPESVPTESTRLAAVIGDPITHSMSPKLHNAAFAALGLDWMYVACQVPKGQGGMAVSQMRQQGFEGLSVTMPHKAEAASAVDQLSTSAARLGVVEVEGRPVAPEERGLEERVGGQASAWMATSNV